MVYKLGFVMEQTLGQVTHALNFKTWVAQDPEVEATWMPIYFDDPDAWTRMPIVRNNWTLRASLTARGHVRTLLRSQAIDGLFFHTQVTALFAHHLMNKVPTVVSMDATPLNFDKIGGPYAHAPSRHMQVEAIKNALTRRTFDRARSLIVWHEWGKRSLVSDYGAPADKVAVIPPGIDLERWNFPRRATIGSRAVRLLFVGGDFSRKGGDTLLKAFRKHLAPYCELDIVTREAVKADDLPNVRVHSGLGPNVPQLMELYGKADIFVFPTLADVLPLAIMEAMASSLPVVTTNVGAITEQIDHGVSGFLIEPGNVDALGAATMSLVTNQRLRLDMGAAARRVADSRFSGSRNYGRVLAVCKACVDQSRS